MTSPASRRGESPVVPGSGKGREDSGPSDLKTRFQLDRTDRLAIALIASLAAVTRLLLLISLPPLLHLDSDSYFEIAQRLWGGHGLGDLSRRTPLYPLLLSLAARSRSAGMF